MDYPKNYVLLTEEEMEYTTGGVSSLVPMALGIGASLLAYLNVASIATVAAQIQQQYPDAYPEEDGTINGNLIIDSTKVYFTSLGGALCGIANIACAAGYAYFLLS